MAKQKHDSKVKKRMKNLEAKRRKKELKSLRRYY